MSNNNADLAGAPLGKSTAIPNRYSPEVLFSIQRDHATARGLSGFDRWTCMETSWLSNNGIPVTRVLQFDVPLTSPQIVESKSVKLYLASLNQARLESEEYFLELVRADIEKNIGCELPSITLHKFDELIPICSWPESAVCLDEISEGNLQPSESNESLTVTASMMADSTDNPLPQHYLFHGFRSLCPVTGQPDWATISLEFTGRQLNLHRLLAYLLSFRSHHGFHELCANQIATRLGDLPDTRHLDLIMHFTRRGGIDITPRRWIGSTAPTKKLGRLLRQ